VNRGQVLSEADRLIHTDRQTDYGTPQQNFDTIGELWTTYLRAVGVLSHTLRITAPDVAAMQSLVKLARVATSPGKEDNWIDLAGYAALGGEVATHDSSGG